MRCLGDFGICVWGDNEVVGLGGFFEVGIVVGEVSEGWRRN